MIFTACVAYKHRVQTRQKIKFVELDFSNQKSQNSSTDQQWDCFIGLVLLHSATKTVVNDSSGLIHFLMCFFLCPATESDRMSESGGYLRFDNFFNCLHFNGNHHQLKTYGEFLLFLVFPNFLKKSGDLPAKTNCVQIYIFITFA